MRLRRAKKAVALEKREDFVGVNGPVPAAGASAAVGSSSICAESLLSEWLPCGQYCQPASKNAGPSGDPGGISEAKVTRLLRGQRAYANTAEDLRSEGIGETTSAEPPRAQDRVDAVRYPRCLAFPGDIARVLKIA